MRLQHVKIGLINDANRRFASSRKLPAYAAAVETTASRLASHS